MKLSTLIKLLSSGQSTPLVGLLKTGNEFYRACFISAALSRGVYENFIDGKASFEHLCEKMAVSNREGLRAWLELGVSLGELKRTGDEYQIKGRISKALLESKNDAYRAYLEEIVNYHYVFCSHCPHWHRASERKSSFGSMSESLKTGAKVLSAHSLWSVAWCQGNTP